MGFFSGIKKLGKRILGGVKKAFQKVGKFVGKVLSSDVGKFVLTAAAVVTGGIALAAGAKGFAVTGSFFDKFVAGGSSFLKALANPVAGAKSLAPGAAPLSQASTAAQAGAGVGSAGGAGGENLAQSVIQSGASAPVTGAEANMLNAGTAAGVGGSAGATGPAPGFLSRVAQLGKTAAGKTYDLLKTPGGGYTAAGLIRGYAEGKMMEDQRNWDDRFNRMWENPDKVAPLMNAVQGNVAVPTGYLRNMRDSADYQLAGQAGNFQRRVTYGG